MVTLRLVGGFRVGLRAASRAKLGQASRNLNFLNAFDVLRTVQDGFLVGAVGLLRLVLQLLINFAHSSYEIIGLPSPTHHCFNASLR